jgi:hypothetical protein
MARAAGEALRTRGAGCWAPLGATGEKKSCVASTAPAAWTETGGGGPARLPPVDGAAERADGLGAFGASTSGVGSAAGAARVSATVNGVPSTPGTPGADGEPVAGSASSEHVQLQTQFQPERGAPVGVSRQAPVQFHTQVQVSGTPGAVVELGEALAPAALAPSPEALAAGARAPSAVAVTPGAPTPLMLAVTPGARAVSSDALTPGALIVLAETLATAVEMSCLVGAAASCWAAGAPS